MTAVGLPRISLVVTGGTIDAVGVDRLDLAGYDGFETSLGPGELIARLPELRRIARVDEASFSRTSGASEQLDDWMEFSRRIRSLARQRTVDGVVITRGTNTIDEFAYFLDLVVHSPKPTVVVGAMRPASGLSADGDLNLFRAVQVAANPASRRRGVLVVMNEAIHSARHVCKIATLGINAFSSVDVGPIGYADVDGTVLYYLDPIRDRERPYFGVTNHSLPRVDIVVSYAGADGAMVDSAVRAGARGIVSAGFGAGFHTPAEGLALERASDQGVVVCQASRVLYGRVPLSQRLVKRGYVAAGNLPPWKARILLALALSRTDDIQAIQHVFADA